MAVLLCAQGGLLWLPNLTPHPYLTSPHSPHTRPLPAHRFISPLTIGANIAILGLALYGAGFPSAAQCIQLGGVQVQRAGCGTKYNKTTSRPGVWGMPLALDIAVPPQPGRAPLGRGRHRLLQPALPHV